MPSGERFLELRCPPSKGSCCLPGTNSRDNRFAAEREFRRFTFGGWSRLRTEFGHSVGQRPERWPRLEHSGHHSAQTGRKRTRAREESSRENFCRCTAEGRAERSRARRGSTIV